MRKRCFLLLCLLSSTLSAQEPAIGSRVRITVAGRDDWRPAGELTRLTQDSLFVLDDPGLAAIRRADIQLVEVSKDTHQNKFMGFRIGTLVGATAGVIAGLSDGNDVCNASCSYKVTASQKAAVYGVLLAVAGGGIGTIIGALSRSDSWVPVAMRTSITPWIGREAVGLTLQF